MTTRRPKITDTASLPHIESLVLSGYADISIGRAYSIPCVAAASDEDQQLAMLVRRKGETLMQLLTRLDKAIGLALEHDQFIDEVNDGPDYSI
jgi:hypothetical protein